jgi:hypothetical protein
VALTPADIDSADDDDLLAPEPAKLTGALVGYARVSMSGQILDRQTIALAEGASAADIACASAALEVCPVELVKCFPVPGVRLGVVSRVVGHRESVAGGVELQGMVHSGVSERAFQ